LILLGSAKDAEVGDAVLAGQTFDLPVIRAEGRATLLQTAALLQRCDLFIGGDSGPLHVAAAAGAATVSVFGPTDPELLAPRGRRHRYVRKRLACSPCYTPLTVQDEAGAASCRLGVPICMLEVSAADVLRAADELLLEKGFVAR